MDRPDAKLRRLGRRERVNYAAFDVNSDIDMEEEDDDGDNDNSLARLVLKEASYEKRDGIRFDRDWLLQEKPYDQNSPVSFCFTSHIFLSLANILSGNFKGFIRPASWRHSSIPHAGAQSAR